MSVTSRIVRNLQRKLEAKVFESTWNKKSHIAVPQMRDTLCQFQQEAAEFTTAILGIGNIGCRYDTDIMLQFQSELAVAHSAVASQLPNDWFKQHEFISLQSKVMSQEEFLLRPDLGRILNQSSLEKLQLVGSRRPDLQIILADGLSANAITMSGVAISQALIEECNKLGISNGKIIGVKYARVWLEDQIGELLEAKVTVIILGERPGLGTGDGLSAYMIYEPKVGKTDADRNMISNIHKRGTLPNQAAKQLALMAKAMLEQKVSGVGLRLNGSSDGFKYRAPQQRRQLVEFQ